MRARALTPTPLPAAHPDPRERGVARANLFSHLWLRLFKTDEAVTGGFNAERCHSPLSRGSGCAAGRGAGGEGLLAILLLLAACPALAQPADHLDFALQTRPLRGMQGPIA